MVTLVTSFRAGNGRGRFGRCLAPSTMRFRPAGCGGCAASSKSAALARPATRPAKAISS